MRVFGIQVSYPFSDLGANLIRMLHVLIFVKIRYKPPSVTRAKWDKAGQDRNKQDKIGQEIKGVIIQDRSIKDG